MLRWFVGHARFGHGIILVLYMIVPNMIYWHSVQLDALLLLSEWLPMLTSTLFSRHIWRPKEVYQQIQMKTRRVQQLNHRCFYIFTWTFKISIFINLHVMFSFRENITTQHTVRGLIHGCPRLPWLLAIVLVSYPYCNCDHMSTPLWPWTDVFGESGGSDVDMTQEHNKQHWRGVLKWFHRMSFVFSKVVFCHFVSYNCKLVIFVGHVQERSNLWVIDRWQFKNILFKAF